jgi:dTDP-4-dehydrorhamnose 3,5-epimerase
MIKGVEIRSVSRYTDARGWLVEIFREDSLPEGFVPVMGYISVTHPGIARGPHEHRDQTDGFVFLDGEYELHLWENRPDEPEAYEIHRLGSDNPALVIVPPGVVHAYRNVGDRDAMVVNIPNRLYAGRNKAEPVDEIRHENDPQSRFQF